VNQYRNALCGKLNKQSIGQSVVLAGWVDRARDHGGVNFIDLRDGSGIAQIVINDERVARTLRHEYVIRVEGKVRARPEGNENDNLTSGDIDVVAQQVTILARSRVLPFQVSNALKDLEKIGDEVRLKYRFLDLRRPQLSNSLRLRARAVRAARQVLDTEGFCEIETPTLIRSTPEGARDFLVPARLRPGNWYALPQSPQLFKQLLMVGGLEKYYQLARCYRDEDFRADRQPEFTQLDIEASFVEAEDIRSLTEKIMVAVTKLVGVRAQPPFPLISYREAMDKYGSDKPDLRVDTEIVELTDYFRNTPFKIFQSDYVGAIGFKGGGQTPRRQFDAWQNWARERGYPGLAYVVVSAGSAGSDADGAGSGTDGAGSGTGGDGTGTKVGELIGPVAKNLSEAERAGLTAAVGAEPGDAIFFSAGNQREKAQELLGQARVEVARRQGLLDADDFRFCWVINAPLFKSTLTEDGDIPVSENSAWTAVHHAFTAPAADWMENFDRDPAHALSDNFDLVLNGQEIGGGSIRIHDAEIQKRVFRIMGLTDDEVQEKFGFLLNAFEFGAPPHGGIALGWDRLVAILDRKESIRDVIAFPKSGGGFDPMTRAPSLIHLKQRREAGVDAKPRTVEEAERLRGAKTATPES
jgi:aspartyl-tRNA synthetase